jgi:hypothetical protein
MRILRRNCGTREEASLAMATGQSSGETQDSMDDTEIRERLAQLSFMLDCRRAATDIVEAFVQLGEQFSAADGTLLLREGDVRGTLGFILIEGRVNVVRTEQTAVRVDAPALLGEMQQFSISGSRSASVVTDGACTLIRFDWPQFYSTLEVKLRPLDFQQVKDAIRRHSWNHALGFED